MRERKERIELSDTALTASRKLAEGNPGALLVCDELFGTATKVDPFIDSGVFALLNLDSFGIYGARIWMLYKDVCRENIAHAYALLRAVQMGVLGLDELDHAIDNRGAGIDIPAVIAALRVKLPELKIDEEHAA